MLIFGIDKSAGVGWGFILTATLSSDCHFDRGGLDTIIQIYVYVLPKPPASALSTRFYSAAKDAFEFSFAHHQKHLCPALLAHLIVYYIS